MDAARLQHLTEPRVAHAVAKQPEMLELIVALGCASLRPSKHLPENRRGMLAPTVGGGKSGHEREREPL
ncbi:MAG: hypothetical protein NTX09_00050 [Verrucomicrobia bacterium]|nr:hypothetical protein [Verrucomicrobiota bacterium]